MPLTCLQMLIRCFLILSETFNNNQMSFRTFTKLHENVNYRQRMCGILTSIFPHILHDKNYFAHYQN